MTLPRWLQSIEDGRGTLPVLLVEGPDDVEMLGYFFTRRQREWRQRFVIAAAEGKRNVMAGLRDFHPEWMGIVDADEWSENELQQAVQRYPTLHPLPRFCIESYFCEPAELWQYIPSKERAGHDFEQFAAGIREHYPAWVAHGAMWRTLHRLYRNNRLPDRLESEPVTDEGQIRAILTEWASQLAPEAVLQAYRQELQAAEQLPADERVKRYIHGKRFFRSRVVNILDQEFSGAGLAAWFSKFRDAEIEPPGDLVPLLDLILEHFT